MKLYLIQQLALLIEFQNEIFIVLHILVIEIR